MHSTCFEKNHPQKVKVKLQIKGIAPCLAFSYLASVDLHLFLLSLLGTAGSYTHVYICYT